MPSLLERRHAMQEAKISSAIKYIMGTGNTKKTCFPEFKWDYIPITYNGAH